MLARRMELLADGGASIKATRIIGGPVPTSVA